MPDSKSLAEINFSLCTPDTIKERKWEKGAWTSQLVFRSALIVEKDGIPVRWWVCSHEHRDALAAYDCASIAHDQVRDGLSAHRLTGDANA